jgi:hypothetical protein
LRHGPGPRRRLLPEDTGSGLAWGDFDGDGDFDLYIVNYPADKSTQDAASGRCGLFRNDGDGFTEIAEPAGVGNADGFGMGACWADYDDDGQLDLFVTNYGRPNRLYRNRGDGSFEDVAEQAGVAASIWSTGAADFRGSMGLSVGETGALNDNCDGLPDLFLTHWLAQENALYQSLRLVEDCWEYRDKTREFRLGEVSLNVVGWGCGFCDLDLDGRQDLVVANGSTLEHKDDPTRLIAEPAFVFWNDGRQFQEIAAQTGEALREPRSARGLAIADFNDDGLPDVAISINRGQPLLLLNETPTEHRFLKIRLRASSARCFGAKVELRSGARRQVQWYGADVSYLSQHAPELIFGLGTEDKADEVCVTWADGRTTTCQSVPAGRFTAECPR